MVELNKTWDCIDCKSVVNDVLCSYFLVFMIQLNWTNKTWDAHIAALYCLFKEFSNVLLCVKRKRLHHLVSCHISPSKSILVIMFSSPIVPSPLFLWFSHIKALHKKHTKQVTVILTSVYWLLACTNMMQTRESGLVLWNNSFLPF